jgi:hypothetical protein
MVPMKRASEDATIRNYAVMRSDTIIAVVIIVSTIISTVTFAPVAPAAMRAAKTQHKK